MKIEIKCRWTGNVLFSHEQAENTIKITLEFAVKARADLTDADLTDANLARANLAHANLARANLARADLTDATGNGREVLSFVALEYRGVYTAEFMWIGCRKHPVKTWWKDSEKDAEKFSSDQIEWRKRNKSWIQAMVKANPAVPTGKE